MKSIELDLVSVSGERITKNGNPYTLCRVIGGERNGRQITFEERLEIGEFVYLFNSGLEKGEKVSAFGDLAADNSNGRFPRWFFQN